MTIFKYSRRMDLTTAQTHLDAWEAADVAVSQGLSYSIGGRTLTRESAREIRDQINYWSRLVKQYRAKAAGSNRGGFKLPSFS